MKKMLALMAAFLILGFAFASAQDGSQAAAKSQEKAQVKTALKASGETTQNKVQTKSAFRHGYRIAFVDENGDGINDLARDADGDGIPNGQDPDWVKPQDGTGNMGQHQNGQLTKAGFGKDSFRSGVQGAGRATGAGVCDGTGPKGAAKKKGGR